MTISQKSIKILWSSSGGRCAFPGCWERLSYHEAKASAPHTIGEMAHICGDKLGANRHDPCQTSAERDDYQNLILLCPTHHTLIDKKENETVFSVEHLHEMKAAHEAQVLERLDREAKQTKTDVAISIIPFLEENRQSWLQYGPMSELARNQPHNEATHAVWVSERLAVIVPNNRIITRLLDECRFLFSADEQSSISAFLLHMRSYEQWVDDVIPYVAVKRFPKEFDVLIRGLVNASA